MIKDKKKYIILFILQSIITSCYTSTIEVFKLGGPIMWVLLILSIINVAIIIEKFIIIFIIGIINKKNGSYKARLNNNLNIVRGISNIAPLAGFLGTVLGMLESFNSMSNSNTITPKIVSKGIYEALLTTAFGLIITLFSLISLMFIEKFIKKDEKLTIDE
ncbi:MAG TPA: MotA/TolQ/ExbB proton channel family protein [Spirochaetota bacterium]|nr:MotA/TolQ/ExbB proton channel family protein [Spirochaetota bacterium]HOM38639.1 MotA/TolQ/ExbB proton channel family protein [Spirochaetota bacterium]HPQ49776.1 MotA/TolQ/ExbB proton channel family protein [Spirochaetota bacterium]